MARGGFCPIRWRRCRWPMRRRCRRINKRKRHNIRETNMSDKTRSSYSQAQSAKTADQIVLVFQGGGALGAYQAGVYQALHEAGIEPDWIIGTSIGAINASLIAGNAPEARLPALEAFWQRMTHKEACVPWMWWPVWGPPPAYWRTLTAGIAGFFEPNVSAFWGAHTPLGVDAAGYYSTMPLIQTLTELVDFDRVNCNKPRLTVGTAHV